MDKSYFAIYGKDNINEWLATTEYGDPMIYGTKDMAENWCKILKFKWPTTNYSIKKVKIFGSKEIL